MIIAAALRPAIDWLARHRVPRAGRARAPLPRPRRRDRASRSRSPCPRALHQVDHALSPSGKAQIARAAQALDRRQAPGAHGAAEAAQPPPERSELVKPVGRHRGEGVRGRSSASSSRSQRRRTGSSSATRRRPRLLAHAATEAQEGPRHVDADRPAPRRVRARAGAADPRSSRSCCRCCSGRSASRTGSSSAPSPGSSRSCP